MPGGGLEVLLAVAALGGILSAAVVAMAALKIPLRSPKSSRWYGLARASGLTAIQSMTRSADDIMGRVGSLEVLFGTYERATGAVSTRLTVRGLSPHIAIKREGLASRLGKRFGVADLQVGDVDFDRALHVQGDEPVVRALLDSETRKHVMTAFAADSASREADGPKVQVVHGEMTADFADDARKGPLPPRASVRGLLDVAHRLQEPADVPGRLADNARREPVAAVRRNVLGAMERTAPDAHVTRAAMERAAHDDPDVGVRLQAALWLAPHDIAPLEALAVDGTVEDPVSARAIQELGERLAPDKARGIFEESLAAGRDLTTTAVALVLGRDGELGVSSLAAALPRAKDPVAVAIAQALGRTGSERAEPPLLAALERDGEVVRAAAATALGDVGTAASVPQLKEQVEATRGVPREAALRALARIRERLSGVDPGRLALAGGAEGELALAEDERGRVALPDEREP